MLTLVLIAVSGATPPLDPVTLSRLFGFRGTTVAAPPPEPRPLEARLLGVLEGELPLASIDWNGRVVSVSPGQQIFDAEILSIHRDRVQVRRGGVVQDIGRSPAPQAVIAGAAVSPSPGRVSVSKLLERPEAVLQSARVVPVFSEGSMRGLRTDWVQPGSLLATLGLRRGDVLRRVNGREVGELLRSWSTLLTSPRLEVELERDGATITQSIDLSP